MFLITSGQAVQIDSTANNFHPLLIISIRDKQRRICQSFICSDYVHLKCFYFPPTILEPFFKLFIKQFFFHLNPTKTDYNKLSILHYLTENV